MKDLTNGELGKQLQYAKEENNNTLQECIDSLKRVDENHGTETEIFTDFAPRSFYFVRKMQGQFRGNGGIIFHGRHDGFGSGQAPSFSVSLDNSPVSRWEIHT